MIYYVSYSGYVNATSKENVGEIEKIADAFSIDTSIYENTISIDGWEAYQRPVWERFLHKIKPYIDDGEIRFKGQDNSNWRFRFITSNWYSENGSFVYDENNAELMC